MGTLKTGIYGEYYGSPSTSSSPLTYEQMKKNATYIYSYLTDGGWSINSISAILGNMEAESTINPGRWQNDEVGNTSGGIGLVQWTPATKYIDWCVANRLSTDEMDSNLARIIYEVENNIQWISTDTYDLTFAEFTTSELSVGELAKAFLLCYERPEDQSESVQSYRASLGEAWYLELTGTSPSEPSDKTKRKKYNFIIFNRRRKEQWIR